MVYSRAWWQPTSSSSAARFTGCASVSSAGGASSAVPVEDSVTLENTSFWVGFKQTRKSSQKKSILRMEVDLKIRAFTAKKQSYECGETVAQLQKNIPSPFSCFSSAGSSTFSLWSAPFWQTKGEMSAKYHYYYYYYYFRSVSQVEKTFLNIKSQSPHNSPIKKNK